MFLKTHNPRTAIIQSYNRPVLYKNHILLNGAVIVKFNPRQAIITSYKRPVLYNNIVIYKGIRLIRFR